MKILEANEEASGIVMQITQTAIDMVYPSYYPRGAVSFFKHHHNDKSIINDIRSRNVYLLADYDTYVGTVTIKKNEICRLFVLPAYQHKGYGKALLDFAENKIYQEYSEIVLDASLPAKGIYRLRGYTETEYHRIKTSNGDYLCYDVMTKHS